jgi:hypothetical protein
MNVKLYKHLLDNYSIPDNVYATGYFISLNSSGQFVGQYAQGNYPKIVELNESNLMHILFSKFAYDKEYISGTHDKYLKYILRDDYIDFYKNLDLVAGTSYFVDGMRRPEMTNPNNDKPYYNKEIIDFDISLYATHTIKHYLFYLDTVAGIYNAAYDLKVRGQCCKAGITGTNQFVIKCRYHKEGIDGDYVLQLSQQYFDLTLTIHRDSSEKQIKDITCMSTEPICTVFDIFKHDIIRHISYLSGDDIYYTDLNYIRTVEYFYRMCRIKLMYIIAHSMRLLPYDDNKRSIHDNIVQYITENILPVLTNLRDNMNIVLMMNNTNSLNSKSIAYTRTVLERSSQLADMNKKIAHSKEKLLTYQTILKDFDEDLHTSNNKHILSTILLFSVILATLFVFMLNVNQSVKGNLSLAMTIVVIVFIIILYIANNNTAIEKFEDNPTKYPMYPANISTGNAYYYIDGSRTKINISGSSTRTQYYNAFDNNSQTQWESAVNKYTNGIKNATTGEYLMIDLGEYIILKGYSIEAPANGGPKNFQIFGSESNYAWNNPGTNTNWEQIDSRSNISYDSISRTFDIRTNVKRYRFFMIHITHINGSGSFAAIKAFELFGQKEIKAVTIESRQINIDSTYNTFNMVQLPSDYSDRKLLDWSIAISADRSSTQTGGEVKAYLDLSIGRFDFTNRAVLSDSFQNIVSPLDAYGSQHITGIAVSTNELPLRNVKYMLTIRYNPITYDIDQERILSETNNIFTHKTDKLTDLDYYNEQYSFYSNLYNAQNSSNAILLKEKDSSNTFLQGIIGQITGYQSTIGEVGRLSREIITSNAFLTSRIATSNLSRDEYQRKVDQVISMTRTLSEITAENTLFENTYVPALASQKQTLFESLEHYIAQSQRAEYNGITDVYMSAKYETILRQSLEGKITDLSSNVLLRQTEIALQSQNLVTMQSEKDAERARLLLEKSSREFEDKLKDSAQSAISKTLEDYEGELIALEASYTTRGGELTDANSQRITNEAALTGSLLTLNTQYGTNFASMQEMNQYLQDKLSFENTAIKEIEYETYQLQLKQQASERANSKANALASINQELAKQTQDTINKFNEVKQQAQSRIAGFLYTQGGLRTDLKTAQDQSSSAMISALDAYGEVDTGTASIINEKRIKREQIIADIATQYAMKFEKQKQEFEAKSSRDLWYNRLQEKINEKLAATAEKDYYKGLSEDIKDDVSDPTNIYSMFQDMDIMIKYKITDNINGINHDLIVPSINNEYHNFDIYQNTMRAYASKSEYDANNLLLNIIETDARTMLFVNICLIITLSMTVYYYLSVYIAGIIAIIAAVISMIVYTVKIKRSVRTGSKYNYV